MKQEKIGSFIALKRKEKKLTQEELASKLNISKNAVSKWERGLSLPDVSTMPLLCEILEITLNELFNGEMNGNNDGIINYFKLQNRKIRLKSIVIILVVIIAIISIFFVNNFDNIKGYVLSGESENFWYQDNLLILSNIKNINVFGFVSSKNDNITEDDIESMNFSCNNYLILETGHLKGIVEENYGYDAYFPKEVTNNLDKCKIEIVYKDKGTYKNETINLKVKKILENKKLLYIKSQQIAVNENNYNWEDNQTVRNKYIINGLLDLGFKFYSPEGVKDYYPNTLLKYKPVFLKKVKQDGSVISVSISSLARYTYYLDNYFIEGLLNSNYMNITRLENNNYAENIVYDMVNDKVISEGKYSNEILDVAQKYAKLYEEDFKGVYAVEVKVSFDDTNL